MTIMDILDNAVNVLKQRDRDYGDLNQWVGYMLEAIESEIGRDALEVVSDVLDERFRNGRW